MRAPLGRAGGRAAKPDQRGQALVEFAFGGVVLLILLTGLLDLSRAFHYTIGLNGAARAGARHGAYFVATGAQNAYLDDADIKQAVDQVLAGDGIGASTFKNNGSCIAGTDSNGWRNPPYDSAAFPTANNAPWLYICYDTQGTRTSTRATAPAKGDSTYSGKDLLVVLLARYGLFGGLSSEYLVAGASLTSIPLISDQHFAVQG